MTDGLPDGLRRRGDSAGDGLLTVGGWTLDWRADAVVLTLPDMRVELEAGRDSPVDVAVQLSHAQRTRTGLLARLAGRRHQALLAAELRVAGRHRLTLVEPIDDPATLAGLSRLDAHGHEVAPGQLLGLLGALERCGATLLYGAEAWQLQEAREIAQLEATRVESVEVDAAEIGRQLRREALETRESDAAREASDATLRSLLIALASQLCALGATGVLVSNLLLGGGTLGGTRLWSVLAPVLVLVACGFEALLRRAVPSALCWVPLCLVTIFAWPYALGLTMVVVVALGALSEHSA